MSRRLEKVLVLWCVLERPDGRPLGLILTNGADMDMAELLATKRWHLGRARLRFVDWEVAELAVQRACLEAETAHWERELARVRRQSLPPGVGAPLRVG